ncbi:hypothetical protein BJX68DRAFT_179358 [Aspergillus pseudodeflectus]|uniref:Uncharacterized protein n=1 Tax=Aspergillus pseudodeflectus TaxID=176178 RepID=A0ABR4L2B7_9EURO
MVIRTHQQLYQLQLSRTQTGPVSGFSGCRKTYRAAKAGMLLKNMRRASVVIRITCSCMCTSSGRWPAQTLVYWLEVIAFSLYAGRADNRRDPPAYLATPSWSGSTIFGQIFWLWGASICQPACFFSPPSHFFIFRLHSFIPSDVEGYSPQRCPLHFLQDWPLSRARWYANIGLQLVLRLKIALVHWETHKSHDVAS